MRRIVIWEFFTTVSFRHFKKSLYYVIFWRKWLLKWEKIRLAEKKMRDYLNLKNWKIISFYNARSALFHCLKQINNNNNNNNNEVIINWYNCVSVSNSVIQAWYKPIYCDIDLDDLSLNLDDLKNKITKKTRAIIVQHSFWKTAKIKKIIKLASLNNILIIEDCAHSLWSKLKWKLHWTFWDFAIFSSWRDKVISSVNGWFLLINNENFFQIKNQINNKTIIWNTSEIIKNHIYNILWFLSFKTYSFFWLWKVIITLTRKFKLINEILYKEEKKCKNKNLNWKFPNSLADLFIDDLNKINDYLKIRRKIAKYYNKNINNHLIKPVFSEWSDEKINYFRYPIILKNIEDKNIFYDYMKKNNILLWNSWSGTNIAPLWSDLEKAMYLWDCKNAENISKRILFLPNTKFLRKKDYKKIVKLINNFKI